MTSAWLLCSRPLSAPNLYVTASDIRAWTTDYVTPWIPPSIGVLVYFNFSSFGLRELHTETGETLDPAHRAPLAGAARPANEALRNAAYGEPQVLTRRRPSSYNAN